MISALTLSVTLAAGIWPFGDRVKDEDATIGTLKRKSVPAEMQTTVPDSTARARDHYQEFLALPGAPTDMRADSMRRLADLYLAAGEDADVAGDAATGATAYRQAIGLYAQYLSEFPARAGTDRVLYSLSRAHEGAGDAAAALTVLGDLVARFPASPVASEAQFRRGERLFVNRDFAGAERAYAAVIAADAAGEYYEQSLYKQGWALFKLGEYEQSLAPFLDVLDRRLSAFASREEQQLLDNLSKPERELVDDSLRAMSLAVSQQEGVAGIDALLARRGGVAFADVVYAGLGDLYLSQERYADAAEAFGGFVQREPDHPRAPFLQAKVISAFAAGRFPSRVLDAKAEFVELYGLDSPYWSGSTPAARPLVVAELKASLADLAAFDHERAQRTRAPDAYQKAAGWYRRWLQYFPEDPESAQRNFLLAEILYEGGDFEAATAEYQRTAYGYGAHAQAAEAGYAALVAAREHEKRIEGAAREAWHLAEIEQQLRFVAAFPAHPEAATVQVNVAEDLLQRGELPRAVQVAGEVVTRMPPATPALERVAWTVLAHGQFDLGAYADAERAYLRLRQFGEADPAKRSEIEERIAASVYKQAEAQRAAGDADAAVAGFLRVAEAAPASTIRPNALVDAAALLMASRQWNPAIDVFQRFRREFPRHEFASNVRQQLALALGEAGRGAEAAAEFEGVATDGALAADVQREALWRAIELYRQAGDRPGEQRTCLAVVERFPQPFAEAIEARNRLAEIARDARDGAARERWLRDIVSVDAAAGASRTDRSRSLAAQATLELATPLRDAFRAARLTAPLAKALKTKKQLMEQALAAYGRAADYGVAEVTTAATFATAELYFQLSRDLLESEKPANLSVEETEEYQLLLEEQAFPFEEKTIELHALNTERAAEGVFDAAVRASFARLAELSPARWARTERSTSYVADID